MNQQIRKKEEEYIGIEIQEQRFEKMYCIASVKNHLSGQSSSDLTDDDWPIPSEIVDNPQLMKFWYQRRQLFSKYDEGIKLDQGMITIQ